jgi:hypothetical protein
VVGGSHQVVSEHCFVCRQHAREETCQTSSSGIEKEIKLYEKENLELCHQEDVEID